ncbi:unnamed protein product [Brachionus calyciflorus]|uniref:Uncharacterized protein n=1 Tax=Brachionus calyciflorus TaxID=104777 RepID=A0A813M6U6_9BILA|nr:unnamed protein product [Brachionus calyciflorus]
MKFLVKEIYFPRFYIIGDPLSFGRSKRSIDIHKKSIIQLEVVKKLSQKYGTRKLNGKVPKKFCPFEQVFCRSNAIYRSIDGSCNNLEHTWYGMTNSPYKRLLPPEYDDGLDAPKTKSVLENQTLPNSRLIALTTHEPNITQSKISNLFLFYGQTIDHDITSIASLLDHNGIPLTCNCDMSGPICFNIEVPPQDIFNRDQTCFIFPRSSASVVNFDCDLGHREQLNTVSHFLDLSFLYGSDSEAEEETRARVRGFLLAVRIRGIKHDYLPFRNRPFCQGLRPTDRCFITGDARAESNAFLTGFQTVFLRQHNLIARKLSLINPLWNDEKLYQETRKIMIALNQHIVYNQWLPILLGKNIYEKYELKPQREGFFMSYDKTIEPYLYNELATAALRFGHTLIKHQMSKADRNMNQFEKSTTDEFLFTSRKFYRNGTETQEDYMRGLLAEDCYSFTSALNPSLNHQLFQGTVKGDTKRFSLGALNIQRGRDHGLPGYNSYRAFCGLQRAKTFEEFINIKPEILARIKAVYSHPDDVDLFTGGTSEIPVDGGVVGETFACLLALQFKELKFGDRFYYENGKDSRIGFSIDQLNEIRKFTMERLLCNTVSIDALRENSFLMPSAENNKSKECFEFPDLNLEKWKDV